MKKLMSVVCTSATMMGTLAIGSGVANAQAILCSSGEHYSDVSSIVKSNTITHDLSVSVAPGSSSTITRTSSFVRSVGAGIDGTTTASVEANSVIAKASGTISVTLKASGNITRTSDISSQWSFSSSSTARRYALFFGTLKVTGNYVYHYCNSARTAFNSTSGTFASWNVEAQGTALCGYPYASGSIERNALIQIGC